MIFWYKNSVLASIISIIGCVMVTVGISTSEIMVAVLGAPLIFAGKMISSNKAFKNWWKQISDAKLIPLIAGDVNVAVSVYNKNPERRTLKKIEEVNPDAAKHIRETIKK